MEASHAEPYDADATCRPPGFGLGFRALLAPLSVTETGFLDDPVQFAGGQYSTGQPVTGTYRFNSWRLGYRYRFASRPDLEAWVGFTGKLRDASGVPVVSSLMGSGP